MPYYVLILTIASAWSTNTSVAEFNDQKHCEMAAHAHETELAKINVGVHWTCNPKGE